LETPKGSALLGVGTDTAEDPAVSGASPSSLLNSDVVDDDTDDLEVVFGHDDPNMTDVAEFSSDAVVASGVAEGEEVVEIKPGTDFDDDETVDDIHVDSDACA
jgi:hypothetical protein